jgi:RNA polymerase primary sigma factor
MVNVKGGNNGAREGGALQAYFNQVRTIPLLSFEEALELSRRIQHGDEEARQKLIRANLRLVIKIARSYAASGVPLMDIIQEGNLGLIRAAEKYDHARNIRFSTYAGWWIRQAISRYVANGQRPIRLPHRKEVMLHRIRRAAQSLSQSLARQPRTAEIAEYVGIPVKEAEQLIKAGDRVVSLELETGPDESLVIEDLHEDYTYNPERMFLRKNLRADTIRFLGMLKDREKRILMDRYQLGGARGHTLKAIGDRMGISPEAVRQIEKKALAKIRCHADELRICIAGGAMQDVVFFRGIKKALL